MKKVCSHLSRCTLPLLLFWVSAASAQAPNAAASARANQASGQSYEGQQISSIAFDPPGQPLEPSDLHSLLLLKPKTPLRLTDLQKTIERLYATGRYEYVEVDSEPSGRGSVALVIRTRHSWFVGHVSVSGKIGEPPNPGQLVNAARLELGRPFQISDVKAGQENIRKLLVANGYYERSVAPKLTYTDVADQVDIEYEIEEGKRAKFWDPRLTGDIQLPENKIIGATKWKKWFGRGWQPITQARVRRGLENVRSKFEKGDRLLATVQLQSLDYDKANNRASPLIAIEAGPRVEIKTIGAKVKRKTLVNNVPIFEEHTVDNDLLEEGRRNLREEFQSKGYFEVEVDYKAQRVMNGKQEIDYLINPGTRHSFVKLFIEGNKYFTTEAIRERLFLTPKSFQFRHGRYSEAFTRRDEQSIANLYRANGFRDVSVTAEPQDDYEGRVGDLAVTLRIDEGPQYIVSKLTIEGPEQIDLKNIESTLSSAEDQPFSEFSIASDRDTIITYYFGNGFANATFEYTTSPGPRPHEVDVTYKIVEGTRQFVRQVITQGLNHTKQKLVNRQISLSPGDPLSPIQMSATQKRLYDLGVFAKVDVAVQNPDDNSEEKYVIYDMEEARRYSVTWGFGAQLANIGGSNAANSLSNPAGAAGFSPRVSLDLIRSNFMGVAHTVSLRGRYSSVDRRALVDYLAPRVFNRDSLDLNFSVLYDDSHDVRTYAARREEASVQLTHRLSKSFTGFYSFSYRNVNVSDLKIDPLLLPTLVQSVRIGMVSANFIQDRRDDPTDAHKGIYNTVETGVASKAFGSQFDFFRILARNATYYSLGRKLVLARQTSFGVEPAWNIPASADPSDPIPLPERFYGGGGNSMRGFPENQAGPRDLVTGFPLGGSALFFNNTEVRYPLLGDNISGVLFHDFGNVFASLGDMNFGVHQNNIEDFNYMVHAVGLGVRYRTPIGPVRLDLAYSINAPRFNGYSGTYDQLVQCSLNNTCVASPQRVSRFQFFFSIGQAF